MPERPFLAHSRASAVLARILERTAADGGKPVAVAVVDDRGDLVAFGRQDGVAHRSLRLALDKAYTSALLECSTRDFVERLASTGRPLGAYAEPRFVALAGGVAIAAGGRMLGAVGVSGRTSEEDHELASLGAAVAPGGT